MSNMENLLMDSGSSSGESDDEVDVPTGRPAATVAVSAPKPAPVAAPPVAAPSSAEDQMKARLKNLYQTQNKRPAQTSASQPPPSSKTSSRPGVPLNPRPGMPHPTSVPPSSRQQSHAPSQTMPTSQPRTNINRQQQPRPQQPMQPVRSPLPAQPGQYSRSNHTGHTSHRTHGTHPSQSSRAHSTSQSRPSSHADVHDPYAPTPLSKIQAREQQKLGRMPSSNSRPSSSMPGSYSGSQSGGGSSQMYSTASGSRTDPTLAAREQEVRRQKERFLIFTRVLIKYLEQKDPNMHRQAKVIIKDCAERNKNKEPGYQSVTASMKTRLKELVGESYWRRAEVYLKHYLDQQKKNKSGAQGSSSSSSTHALKQQQQQQQQQQLERQKLQQQQQRQRAAQMQAQRRTAQAQHHQQQQQSPNLALLQQEVSNRRSEIARVGGVRTQTSANVVPTKGTVVQQKKPAVPKVKGRAVTPTPRKPGTPVAGSPTGKAEEPPKEYLELMQMVDHAVLFDYKAAGQLIKSNKADLQVNQEQRKLLYSERNPKPSPPKKEAGLRSGWDRTNVFSARAAWARVRLPEGKTSPKTPVVGGGLLTLPSATPAYTNEASTTWTNEEKAEQDVVLAMLSEGCQHYLKGILQKAVHCARQRQNVDGVRLWHQQHTAATQGKAAALSLRLGCDISRQLAQAAGSAATTCKRMEEALERQSHVPASTRILNDETLEGATSMGDLSLRPQLAKAVEGADLQARRSYELYGGKHSSEPPLGRVPKKAKVEKIDLIRGSNLGDNIGRHRAVTSSGSTYY
mmetsp:Transcript_40053/g.96654  ORF Transcript_40053/g.96654 Transcript_40053/m.96654 type:complete len:794 (+) Transcript_40053:78-2459(+)